MINLITNFIRKHIFFYIIFIEIYKKYINIFKFVEGDKYKFIKYSKIKNFIDVGSNDFQTTKLILSYKKIKVFCYDPIKLSNKHIQYLNRFKKKILFNNYALWNKNEKNFFFVPYYKGYELSSLSSFFKNSTKNYFKKLKISMNQIEIKKRFVICIKLDNKSLNFQFLKIDAENSELAILKGAQKNIKKNNPIILLENNKDLYKIKKFLKKFKYQQFSFYNYTKKKFQKNKKNLKDIYFLNKESFKYLQ